MRIIAVPIIAVLVAGPLASQEKKVVQVSAAQLLKDFKDDEGAAYKKYRDQLLEVTGSWNH